MSRKCPKGYTMVNGVCQQTVGTTPSDSIGGRSGPIGWDPGWDFSINECISASL